MDAAWNEWFTSEKVEPLRITYSELSEAPYATLDRVLEALGLEAPPQGKTIPPVAKLADTINDEWAERFRSELPTVRPAL